MKQYKEKIVGWVNKTGTFNDNPYDNINLVVITEENGIPVSADSKNYKFKKVDCAEVLGFPYEPSKLDELTGVYISKPYFDKFGRLMGVDYE